MSFALVFLFALLAASVSAQIDPKQMAGIPRPVTDLPNATVSVRLIRGQLSNNITDFPVELHVGSQVRTVRTDEGGRAEFGSLPAGATLKAVAVVDGERLESQEFPAPAEGGIRLMLVATDTSKGPRDQKVPAGAASAAAIAGTVAIGGQTRIILEPAEESVSVYYLLDIVNRAQTPVNPPAPFTFDMPPGSSGTTLLEGSSANATVNGSTVQVAGPFPPGRTIVQAAARVPVDSASLDISQRFPAAIEQLSVVVRKLGDTKLSSAQLAQQQDMNEGGETFIAASGPSVAANQPIVLSLANLPHHSPIPRRTALSLAGLIVVAGAWLARTSTGHDARAAERKRLIARREKLFADLVRLEHERRAGKVADRYASRREALLASLEQVYGALDSDDQTGPLFDGPAPGGPLGPSGQMGPGPADRPGVAA